MDTDFKGKRMGHLYGEASSGGKEFTFKTSGNFRHIRLRRLAKEDKGKKVRLKQERDFVRLIIEKPKALQIEEIEIAEYYVLAGSTGLRVQLLSDDKEHREFAKAIVVEVAGSRNETGIFRCRIRRDKKVPLLLGFTKTGEKRISEHSIEYPWTSLLKLRLSDKNRTVSLDTKTPQRTLHVPGGGSLTLSWIPNQEEGKIAFRIRTTALANWRTTSRALQRDIQNAQNALDKYRTNKKKHREDAWAKRTKGGPRPTDEDKKKWNKEWDNEWQKRLVALEERDDEPKKKLDALVERIRTFAEACEGLSEIKVWDPWDVPLERFKIKFPIPPDKNKIRKLVELLGKSWPKKLSSHGETQ